MPQSALRHVVVDACLPLAKIAPMLVQLAGEPAPAEGVDPVAKKLAIETRIARGDHVLDTSILELGQRSPYTCPECHGVLVQLQDGGFIRFRCHTGHAFSLSGLVMEMTQSLETSLWGTLRTIKESVLLLQHLARHARDQQDNGVADLAERKARYAEQSAEVIRDLLSPQESLSENQLREAG